MKIVTVIGARPQFIKAAAVSLCLAKNSIDEVLLHTGQHFDANMSGIFFEELGIPKPCYNLGVGGGLHGAMTGAQLAGVEEVLLEEKPDWLLVYGDTNSTLAGALAAAKLNIPVAHVEAGLRSFNRKMPEEVNRVITDHVSTALFAPTALAMKNLDNEGISRAQCSQVGDVMYDAALVFGERAKQNSSILEVMGLQKGSYILATIHRAENTDDLHRLKIILASLKEVSKTIPVIWPVHPRTRNLLDQWGLRGLLGSSVRLIDPVGYLDIVMLEQNAAVITTDSGGVQKEAFFYSVPCVTLRDETEWSELVDSGWNSLVKLRSVEETTEAILNANLQTGEVIRPYGEGDAALKITNYLKQNS